MKRTTLQLHKEVALLCEERMTLVESSKCTINTIDFKFCNNNKTIDGNKKD
jgi:hypothetical protein